MSFRAKGHRHEDDRLGVLWPRYICFAERGSRRLLFRYLGERFVASAGQGGGGGLSDEELFHAVFCGLVAVFRDGSVVHTDSAQACISLGQAEPSLEAPPAAVQEAMASGPPQSDGVSFFLATRDAAGSRRARHRRGKGRPCGPEESSLGSSLCSSTLCSLHGLPYEQTWGRRCSLPPSVGLAAP